MMLHAVPKSFGPFFALRLLLGEVFQLIIRVIRSCSRVTLVGALESCVAPILILIVSMFYTKKEQASGLPSTVTVR